MNQADTRAELMNKWLKEYVKDFKNMEIPF